MNQITYDASGKILGRLASQVASALRGKHLADYRPDRLPAVTVVVRNAAAIKVTGRKLTQKTYYRFSGYPGGLKRTKLIDKMKVDPATVLRLAVKRMLPPNRSRAKLLRQLIIEK